MDELVEGLKKRIEEARRARGLTRKELAEGVGARSASTVTEWYTAGTMPAAGHVVRLPEVLDVSAHWLLTGEGPMDRPADGVDGYAGAMLEAAGLARSLVDELERRAGRPGPEVEPGTEEPTADEDEAERIAREMREEEERRRQEENEEEPPAESA